MENKNPLSNRYEFVLFYDVENGNPNGDPDAGNMPRIDPETGYGIVTDVCLKRKIGNYVELVKKQMSGYRIYVTEGAILNNKHAEAYIGTGNDSIKDKKKPPREIIPILRKWMCDNFYDIRTFGAVMALEVNCGQVRGPVQLNFSRSLDPIAQQELTITRVAIAKEKDRDDKYTTIGRKHIVPYALYRVEGYISPALANHEEKGTGFSEEDLELLWQALENMFEFDRSASRGKMASRKLFIFKHDSELGNAPSHKLFDLITCELDQNKIVPRQFSDYSIHVDRENLPQGVELIERL